MPDSEDSTVTFEDDTGRKYRWEGYTAYVPLEVGSGDIMGLNLADRVNANVLCGTSKSYTQTTPPKQIQSPSSSDRFPRTATQALVPDPFQPNCS